MSVIELGQSVTIVLPRPIQVRLAEAARANGVSVEQEAIDRLTRSLHRRRASDEMDDFLAAACRPTPMAG